MANITPQGEYDSNSKTAKISDRYNPILHPDQIKGQTFRQSLMDALSGRPAPNSPKLSSREKQKAIEKKQDRFLNAAIHELKHAEDDKKYGIDAEHPWQNHFMESVGSIFEKPADGGKKDDIQRAALHRLMNMGTEEKQEPKPESEFESEDQKYIREALKKLGVE